MRYNKLKIALAALIVLSTTACSDDDMLSQYDISTTAMKFKLSKYEIQFGATSDLNSSNTVDYLNTRWETKELPTWLMQSPLSGGGSGEGTNSINYSAKSNYKNEKRTAIVTYVGTSIEDGSQISKDLVFNQSASYAMAYPYINGTNYQDQTYIVPGGEQTITLSIASNADASISANVNWMKLNIAKITSGINEQGEITPNEVELSIEANPYAFDRLGKISIESNGSTIGYMYIKQGIASTSVSVTSITMPRDASTKKVTINSDIAWKAFASASTANEGETPNITQVDWLDVTPKQGPAGDKQEISISTTDNTLTENRVGYVIFANEKNLVQDVIRVEQDKSFLSRADDDGTISTDMRAKDITASILSNTEWYLYSAPDWVNVSPSTGKGNANLTLSVKTNETSSTRSGSVIILPKGLTAPTISAQTKAEFTIEQTGPTISIDNADITFDGNGGTQTVNVKADAPWSISSTQQGDNWLSITPVSGNGDATVTITAAPNNTRAQRSAYLTITMAGITKVVNIAQASKYINLTQSATEFDSHGGTWKISVKSSSKWTVHIDSECAKWVSATDQSGTGDKDITLTIADNASANARMGKVEITLDDGQVVVASIQQKGRYMRLPFSTAQLFAKGGSKDVEIDTDGQLAFEQTGDWFVVTPLSGNLKGYQVHASANTSNIMREGSLRIYLTDLTDGTTVEGTLRIIQAPEGVSFTIEGYGEDKDLNNSSDGGGTTIITIGKGYSSDKDFNSSSNGGSSSSITMGNGYSSEQDFNNGGSNKSNTTISIGNTFSSDNDFNNTSRGNSTTISIGKNYSSDKNFN